MGMNPYEYDSQVQWTPPQNQIYQDTSTTARTGREQSPVLPNQSIAQKGADQKPKQPARMPKARTLAIAHKLKNWIVVASILSFGTFSGLAAFHQVSTTATSTSSQQSSKTTQSTSSTSSSSSNSFLNQNGGNNLGTSTSTQGTTSGSSTSSSAPVTGSSTS